MIDLGHKVKNVTAEVASGPKKDTVTYPDFYVEGITLPVSEKDVGKIIGAKVNLKVKKAGAEIDYDNKKKYRASFSVIGIEFGAKSLDEQERDEYERNPIKSGRR